MPSPRPHRRLSRLVVVLGAVLLLAALGVVLLVRQGVGAPAGTDTAVAAKAVASAPASPDVRLAVAGDVGTGDGAERATADAMARRGGPDGFDALVLLGDNIYEKGDPARADEAVLGPFADVLRPATELVAALGNHDVRDGHGPAVLAALGQPGPWHVEHLGPVDVVVLDSNRPDDPEQTRWLEDTLRSSSAAWQVVAMHHPPYSAGVHGSDLDVRAAWSPIFARYGVDLVLSGHDHDYQRNVPVDGVQYVVSGAAAKLRPTGQASFTEVSTSTRHFLDVTATDKQLSMLAVATDGTVFDGLTLTHPAERQKHHL